MEPKVIPESPKGFQKVIREPAGQHTNIVHDFEPSQTPNHCYPLQRQVIVFASLTLPQTSFFGSLGVQTTKTMKKPNAEMTTP